MVIFLVIYFGDFWVLFLWHFGNILVTYLVTVWGHFGNILLTFLVIFGCYFCDILLTFLFTVWGLFVNILVIFWYILVCVLCYLVPILLCPVYNKYVFVRSQHLPENCAHICDKLFTQTSYSYCPGAYPDIPREGRDDQYARESMNGFRISYIFLPSLL